ncbi:MAG TPA: serine hydrolase domain-containing protein [Rhodothermales bacterium]|nr:serine hydrolase domain-containing protein [Rhodothermales bacterium]
MRLPILAVLFATASCAHGQPGWNRTPTPAPPAARPAGPAASLAARVDSLLDASIRDRAFPGASVAIGIGPDTRLLTAAGRFTYERWAAPVTTSSPFDMASLTKVIATTTAAMLLYERNQLDLDVPLARYLPELERTNKRSVTVRQVMTHSAGLRPFISFHTQGVTTRDRLIQAVLADSLVYAPGTDTRYSDFGFILLGLAIERITGLPLDQFTARDIWGPLGMTQTHFRPVGRTPGHEVVVPTEVDTLYRRRLVQGEVHDETAWTLGGVAGHAGLFSTAEDLAKFAAMLATDGRLPDGRQFLRPQTIRTFVTRAGLVSGSTRAIGWDTRSETGYSSAGTKFGPRSYGHTGFTGTSLWVDPDRGLWVVLLANRVYPTRNNNKHSAVRARIADIAFESAR